MWFLIKCGEGGYQIINLYEVEKIDLENADPDGTALVEFHMKSGEVFEVWLSLEEEVRLLKDLNNFKGRP